MKEKQIVSDEDVNVYSLQCMKCGSMKVESAHHCSKCKRCVYKMDHHCPWTDNCVGYMNIKPFMLFIMYAFLVCCYGLFHLYIMAWKHEMAYISFQNLIPMGMGGMNINSDMMRLATSMYYKNKDPENSKAILKMPKHGLFGTSPFQSIKAFLDFASFVGLVALTVYVGFIFGMVWFYT